MTSMSWGAPDPANARAIATRTSSFAPTPQPTAYAPVQPRVQQNPYAGSMPAPPPPSAAAQPPALPPITPPSAAAAAPSTYTAQTNPALDALQGRYNSYIDNLEGNTGHIMDVAGSKLRDARDGGRTQLQASEAARGVRSSGAVGRYDTDTQRGVQGAITDIATNREAMLGGALQGGLGIARAPADTALAEKGFSLSAAAQEQNKANTAFNQFLALLQSQRSSPIYSGAY